MRQPAVKLQAADARIVESELEKLGCQLAREKEVEGLRQAVKELEKKFKEQTEAKRKQRMLMIREIVYKKEQEEMLWGELARCGAAPGGELEPPPATEARERGEEE